MDEDRILNLFVQGSKHNTISPACWKSFYQKEQRQATAYIKSKKYKKMPRIKFSQVKIKKNNRDLLDVLKKRKSYRKFSLKTCRKQEMLMLIKASLANTHYGREYKRFLRAYPSGGALFGVETFVAVDKVQGMQKGFYFCDVHNQELILLKKFPAKANLKETFIKFNDVVSNPSFIIFLTAHLKYLKKKYNTLLAYKIAMLESGHMMQNLMLAAVYWNLKSVPLLCFRHDSLHKYFMGRKNDLIPLYAIGVGR